MDDSIITTHQEITYRNIADLAIAYCKNNCANYLTITDDEKFPPYFRDGYDNTAKKVFGSYCTLIMHRVLSNNVTAISDDTIEGDMTIFLEEVLNLTPANQMQKISNINYFNYLCDIAVFCTTRIGIIIADNRHLQVEDRNNPKSEEIYARDDETYVNESRLVYIPGAVEYNNIIPLDINSINTTEGVEYDITEVNTQFQSLMNSLNDSNRRVVKNLYTITIQPE